MVFNIATICRLSGTNYIHIVVQPFTTIQL